MARAHGAAARFGFTRPAQENDYCGGIAKLNPLSHHSPI